MPLFQSNYKEKTNPFRSVFPRSEKETYLNNAGTMPLSSFSEQAIQRYSEFQRLGFDFQGEYVLKALGEAPKLFAQLIGAKPNEIGHVHCTKAGEQIAISAVDHIKKNGNIVTNDLHFSGSLHNLVGHQKQGRDVRFVRAKNWQIHLEDMEKAIDAQTALVTLSLVSNVNGHQEAIKRISDMAHKHGALVYADIIQAAGITPVDVKAMGIDIAACSCYKWLYGIHGSGFLFVDESVQATRLKDQLFPGHCQILYPPWSKEQGETPFSYKDPENATRYQPGHINYLGYCAAYEGLKFIHEQGQANLLAHSEKLNLLLRNTLQDKGFHPTSPEKGSPIQTFSGVPKTFSDKLRAGKINVSYGQERLRFSPAIYNDETDIEKVLQAIG